MQIRSETSIVPYRTSPNGLVQDLSCYIILLTTRMQRTHLLASLSPLLLRACHLAVFVMDCSLFFCCTRLTAFCLRRSSLSCTALWDTASCWRRDSSLRCCCWTMWLRWLTAFPDAAASSEAWLRSFPRMSANLETRPLWKQSATSDITKLWIIALNPMYQPTVSN